MRDSASIRAKDTIGQYCISPVDGRAVALVVSRELNEAKEVRLDFASVTALTSSFVAPMMSHLYSGFGADEIDHRLKFSGLDEIDRAYVELICGQVKRFLAATPEQQQKIAEASMRPFDD